MAKKRVLIVDDSPDIVRMLELLLSDKYEVITALDGMSGLEKVYKYQPDIVVLDIMMPKMSGYQMVETMKKNARMHPIPVIFLTAKGGTIEKEFGLKKGATIYMTKPFDPTELLQNVEILLKFGVSEQKERIGLDQVVSNESAKKNVEWK